ncbi:PAS domain-containing protein [Pseudorhodoferax sp. Leaf267]|uniref:PAS domain-containing protein n=1 Tax=Pseudorhodoferax sp. Leaf267 TaxID=1736316 RepID=UPI000ACAD2F6|nr:PAS domain-containing protein [Pseudorhodoferax sp. Leaf267]
MNDRDLQEAGAPPLAHFLPDGTPTAALLRARDWAASSLGHPQGWPLALRGAVSLLLDSPVPMWLAWGPDLAMVYNAPYARMLGSKHPAAMGAPLREVWAEMWAEVGPLVATALAGQALYRDDLPLPANREGRPVQAWFTFLYLPLRDAHGAVQGLACTVWETTDKVLAQHRLAASEARLQALTLASSNVIYRMSADWTRMLELNGQGFIADASAPDSTWLQNYIHPDDRAGVTRAIQAAVQSGSTFELEHRVIQVDGTLGWALSRAIPVRDAAGHIVEWFGTATNVTARHTAQQALEQANVDLQQRIADTELRQAQKRETEERYRLAVLATNDAIWDWRLADGQVVWNKALFTLFGHTQEETSADWWLDHIHPEDRPRVEASIHDVIDSGRFAWSDEYRFQRADASYADIFDRGTVLRDPQGRPLRMIGAMLDLSERKAAEAALRESERQFRTLFETIDEGFCVIEFLDGPEGPLSDYVHVLANPAYAANAGIPDVVGQRVREMVPQEADAWVEVYRRVLLTGEPVRFERELVRTGRYLELAALRVEPPERRQVAVLFQDITARRRAELALRELNEVLENRVAEEVAERLRTEEALRQSQKMEAVGQLTGGIAHDFNNMLAVVIGSLDLLGRRYVGDDARARRYVDAAKDGAKRAAQLTQRLLAFSRQQPLKPEPVDANKLVAGMSDLLRHSLGGDVRLETVLAGGLWRAHADPHQLENVILNLAVNSRDAMALAEGGRLTIETANCHLDERYAAEHIGLAPGQYVMIAVSDTGSGMSAEVIAKAFDPFFTTKEVGRGTGLGLSQVYGFVKQSGGHVKIYSEVGQGTAVKVYLPRLVGAAEADTQLDTRPDVPLGDGQELVLVVEDEPAVRQFSVEALTELGYRVLEADGAAEALKLIDAHPEITLLFTDVVMPEVNGRKLADQARLRRPGLKVLFTTGYTRNAVVHNGVLDPGVHLIGKPFNIDELGARVREVLDAPEPAGE